MESTILEEFYDAKDWNAEIEGLKENVKEKDTKIKWLERRIEGKSSEIKSLQSKLVKRDDYNIIERFMEDLRRLNRANREVRDESWRLTYKIKNWEM